VRQHLGDPTLNTAAIAAAVRVSPRSINRLLAAEGISLMHYLWDCRLQQAQTLLLSGRVPKLRIEEIAWRCGFSDPTHFSRSFKSRYGVPPVNSAGRLIPSRKIGITDQTFRACPSR
jgi:transcriptional regulator GlxA family with amidase domain